MNKPQSKERGQAWKLIAENLNKIEKPVICVAVRALRDRFSRLMEKFQKNEQEDARAAGIQGKEFDKLYPVLSDINDRMEDVKLAWEEATEKEHEKKKIEKLKDMDMQKRQHKV